MEYNQVEKMAGVFKLMSDPTRLRILHTLFHNKDLCVNEIAEAVGISHSAASHQLSKLEAKGIVSCKRVGQMACYNIEHNDVTDNLQSLIDLCIKE